MNALNAPPVARPFTRLVTVPAAFPWDQQRAARLEAQHTSPLTAAAGGTAPAIIVKRLEPWRPGQAGRFLAIYLKGADAQAGLSFVADVQGKPVTITLPSRRKQAEQLKARSLIIGLMVLTLSALTGQVAITLKRRSAAEAELARLEQVVNRAIKQNASVKAARENAQALEGLGLRGQSAGDVLSALKVVTTGKAPQARIDSFLWEGGDWALEVRGEEVPLGEGQPVLQKAPKPVRRDTWLWVHTGAKP